MFQVKVEDVVNAADDLFRQALMQLAGCTSEEAMRVPLTLIQDPVQLRVSPELQVDFELNVKGEPRLQALVTVWVLATQSTCEATGVSIHKIDNSVEWMQYHPEALRDSTVDEKWKAMLREHLVLN